MTKTAVVFNPAPFLPARSGANQRCLEMCMGLRELGFTVRPVTFFPWEEDDLRVAREAFPDSAVLDMGAREARLAGRMFKLLKLTHLPISTDRVYRWAQNSTFTQLIENTTPDLILMNYSEWDYLLDHRRFSSIRRIVDIIDLKTLNDKMWKAVEAFLPEYPIDSAGIAAEVVDESFYTRRDLQPSDQEFAIFDRYSATVAITEREAEIIRKRTRNTMVAAVPMTQQIQDLNNTYSGPALFPTGPNPYNIQGLLYFMRRVLPVVRTTAPDFTLDITGYCSDKVLPTEGVNLLGFVPDLAEYHRHAAFLICPVFGGTGQQVKIIEAMARGLPVVAIRFAAERTPIEHGVNGFIADNAAEFAEYTVQLWRDRELCRRLGGNARETIRERYSKEHLLEALQGLIFRDKVPVGAMPEKARA